MKRLFIGIALFGLTLIFMYSGCVLGVTPVPALTVPEAGTPSPTKPAWQEEWEKAVSAAKQEGKVTVITRLPPSVRDTLAGTFKEKYGIEIEYTPGILAEFWPKIEAERRTGLYLRDIITGAGSEFIKATMIPAGAVDPIEKELILPEVKDPNVWRDKRLPFFDEEGKTFLYLARVGPTIVINKDLVRSEEIKSWRNLLEPKWKGKILLNDPSIAGPGNSIIVTLREIMGMDFLKELAKQDPVMNRDMRLQVEWVGRGKYSLGLGFEFAIMEEMRDSGVPIAHAVPSEGTYFGSAVGAISMFNRPAHPNAAKVFMNWFLSKQGQTLMAKAAKEQSRRVDIVPELPPDRLFQEGIKYVDFDTDYMFNKRTEMYRLSKEIFAAQYN